MTTWTAAELQILSQHQGRPRAAHRALHAAGFSRSRGATRARMDKLRHDNDTGKLPTPTRQQSKE